MCVGHALGLMRSEVEITHAKFKDSDVSAHIHRSLFDVVRQYRESIEAYGDNNFVEWQRGCRFKQGSIRIWIYG